MHKTQWMLYTKKADFYSIGARFNISPVLARIIVNRGIPEEEMENFLTGQLTDMRDPHLLADIDEAADMILDAVDEGIPIRVVGDYDVDGICAAYILYTALSTLGADVSYDIPDRIRDGYGINDNIIRKAAEDGVGFILTCDNGIAAGEAIALARELGMAVVVTDHHEVPKDADGADMLPPADAVVDPKRADCGYPFKEICGAMVAYKLIEVIYEAVGMDSTDMCPFLDFAALATVCDVMKLTDENRIIVKAGLKHMALGENLGLTRLIEAQGLDRTALSAYHMGFVIGPCLNAGGRLESAKTSLRLFLTDDENEAEALSSHLKMLNDERKLMTAEYTAKGVEQAEGPCAHDRVKVVWLPGCHESVAGIIAGRIKETCYAPAIVLTEAEDGSAKGSARSIPAYNIYEKLAEAEDLLLKFGGHPMAAGLTLSTENVDRLRTFLNERSGLTDADMVEKIWIDAALPFEYCTTDLIGQLSKLEPFGTGNEKPAFAQKGVKILSVRIMGRGHNVIRLRLKSQSGCVADGVLFTDGDAWLAEKGQSDEMDVIYYPSVNEYGGNTSVQLIIKNWKFKTP